MSVSVQSEIKIFFWVPGDYVGKSFTEDHFLYIMESFEYDNHSSIPCFTGFGCIIPLIFLFTQSQGDTVTQLSN